jgi:hypothetical protein
MIHLKHSRLSSAIAEIIVLLLLLLSIDLGSSQAYDNNNVHPLIGEAAVLQSVRI